MKVCFISPKNVSSPMLFDTFGLQEHSIEDADTVFFDLHSGLFDYDWSLVERVVERKLPVVVFDQFDYFTGCGYVNTYYERIIEQADRHWAKALKLFQDNGLVKVYFMRKMSKTIKYPSCFYPYELIQYPDHDFPMVSQDELFSRPYDFCFIGNTATPRENICEGLEKHFKCDFVLAQPRLEHNEWLNRHRQAKFFIECGGGGESGGGFNSERSYQLITISPMLKVIDEQLLLHDWTNGINCLKASEIPTEWEINFIRKTLENKDRVYKIYNAGVNYMKENYSEKSRAEYILSILKQEKLL